MKNMILVILLFVNGSLFSKKCIGFFEKWFNHFVFGEKEELLPVE